MNMKQIISAYLIRYGKDIANHVNQMVNTLEGGTSFEFFNDFYFFYYLFPKINFYSWKELYSWFMEEFEETNSEYIRISKMFEYLCKELCGIKRNRLDVDLNLKKFCYDLQGFDRTGEYCEV